MSTQDQIRDAYKKGYTDAVTQLIYTPEGIAQAMHWEGDRIASLFLDALTDANYHILRTELEPIINKHLTK
jgi:hypothetical protein